jgi:hypothetical protein
MKNITHGLDNFNIDEHHCDDYSVSAPDTILVRSVGVDSQVLGSITPTVNRSIA